MHDETYQALFDRLEDTLTDVTWTRKALFWDQVNHWPTGCVVATHQEPLGDPGMPRRWIQSAMVIIYHKPTTSSPDTELNDFVDRIERALLVQDGEQSGSDATTLGGAVTRAWLQGPVVTGQERDGLAAVSVEIHMLR